MGGDALEDEARGRDHGEAAVRDLLGGERLGHREAKRVEAKVARRAHARLAAGGRGDARRHLDHRDEHDRRRDDVRVLVPEVPEHVHLRAAIRRAELEARRRAEELLEDDARRRKHRDARVLELRLAQPVEVDANVIDLGQAQRVEARIARHSAVEKRRLLQERQRLAHLSRHHDGGPRRRVHRGERDRRRAHACSNKSTHIW